MIIYWDTLKGSGSGGFSIVFGSATLEGQEEESVLIGQETDAVLEASCD